MDPNKQNGIERAAESLKKDYIVVGKAHVRAWHLWLGLGVVAGIVAGVFYVANRSGQFEPGLAGEKDLKVTASTKDVVSGGYVNLGIVTSPKVDRITLSAVCPNDVAVLVDVGQNPAKALAICGTTQTLTPPSSGGPNLALILNNNAGYDRQVDINISALNTNGKKLDEDIVTIQVRTPGPPISASGILGTVTLVSHGPDVPTSDPYEGKVIIKLVSGSSVLNQLMTYSNKKGKFTIGLPPTEANQLYQIDVSSRYVVDPCVTKIGKVKIVGITVLPDKFTDVRVFCSW